MTVNQINRSHRVAYLVFLLVVAVALTTALVLAAERNSLPITQIPKTMESAASIDAGE